MGRQAARGAVAGACLLAVVLAGCDLGEPRVAPPPSTPSAAQACTSRLQYWADRTLEGELDPGLDYQEMALADAEYDILRAALDRARPVSAAQGATQAERVAAAELRRACEEHTRTGPQPRGTSRVRPQ